MAFIVEKDINTKDFKAMQEEIGRLTKQLGYVKTQITNAEKEVRKLEKNEELLTSDVDEIKRERVTNKLETLQKAYTSFEEIAVRIHYFHTCQLDIGAETDTIKVDEEITALDKAKETYEDKYYSARAVGLRIKNAQNGPPTARTTSTISHASHKHNWKPTECYKPGILQVPAEVNLQQFEEWIGRLKAHLEGHEHQNVKNINIIVGDLIHKDVKSAINFDPKATTPIFSEKEDGTKQENSLEGRLKDYWERKNPLSKLRSEAFGLQSTKYETFDQWKSRAKQTFSKADLSNINGPAIEGLIVLMNFHGPYCDEIRKKVVEKFKEGIITIPDIEAIAQEIELVETMNDKQDPSQLNKLHFKGDKNDKNKKPMHQHLKNLSKEGKCFSCAGKHGKDNKCKRESFTCIFCKKPNHTKPACTSYYDHLKAGGTPSKFIPKTKPLTATNEDSDQQLAEETRT